jgi:NhaP-type Na+/H+ or K+/H+ antiporter
MTPQQISQATLAFTLANGFAIQLITLSAALIGLTVTFAKDFQQNTRGSLMLLIAIWVAFFLSILCGISTIKALITVVAPLKPTDAPFAISDDALRWAKWQERLFFLGLILFIGKGVSLIWSKRSSA